MKRRTLDAMVSVSGLVVAVMLAVLAVVMTSNANFAKSYVHDQLAEQKVFFPPKSAMKAEELAQACVSANAGKQVLSGAQAECYANHYIGLHVKGIANGKTYAELGGVQFGLQDKLAAAQAAHDTKTAAELQTQLTAVTGQRETLFQGETLRGLLLTSFGFSTFGVKGAQAANVCYIGAAIVALLSIAGLWHASRTKATEAVAPVDIIKPVRRAKAVSVA
jgi:hypothetical protein